LFNENDNIWRNLVQHETLHGCWWRGIG